MQKHIFPLGFSFAEWDLVSIPKVFPEFISSRGWRGVFEVSETECKLACSYTHFPGNTVHRYQILGLWPREGLEKWCRRFPHHNLLIICDRPLGCANVSNNRTFLDYCAFPLLNTIYWEVDFRREPTPSTNFPSVWVVILGANFP